MRRNTCVDLANRVGMLWQFKTITYWISETNEVQDFVNLVKIKYTVTVLKHNIDILHIL